MSGHTPGPWEHEASVDARTQVVFKAGTNWLVCETGTLSAEANARLIAAAPDQNAALIKIVAAYDSAFDERGNVLRPPHETASLIAAALVDCRAAIAKAEGR